MVTFFPSRSPASPGGAPVSESELFALLIAREAIAQYKGTPFQSPIEEALRKLSLALKPKLQVEG
jgi:hypothetical protein